MMLARKCCNRDAEEALVFLGCHGQQLIAIGLHAKRGPGLKLPLRTAWHLV